MSYNSGISINTRNVIYIRDAGICQLCNSPVDFSEADVDHIIPRAFGGSNLLDNLQITHATCNNAKGSGISSPEYQNILKSIWQSQDEKCYLCNEPLQYSRINKIVKDFSLTRTISNTALAHKDCRILHNQKKHAWIIEHRHNRRAE